MKKFVSIVTAVAAFAALSASASAYNIDVDLGFGWSTNTTIPGEEFDDATTNTLITFTYEANTALAAMPGQEYWCIKPMINDEGWPFLKDLIGPELSEGGDSVPVDMEGNSVSFKLNEEDLEHVKIAGMALMGHGVKLLEMTLSEDASSPAPADPAPADSASTDPAPTTTAPANPDSGVESLAVVGGVCALALGAMIVTKKRK